MSEITYDPRAILIDGQRTLILSGAIHYPRNTYHAWPELMRKSRAAGLNTIETYVFWNLHERRRGIFDFSGRLDLRRFCQLAQDNGLHVILRIGPYICAETNYGGLPAWLREVPGIQMRTDNEPFKQEMARWVRLLCDYLRGMFAPQGGPIILAQVDNEYNQIAHRYGEAGKRYVQWAADLGNSLQIGIPWIMCDGGAEGTIETINHMYGHTLVARKFEHHPDQPALWTEAWPGWYAAWGHPRLTRDPEDVAYATARFFAAGGTGINYYMWHGGMNFGRESMFLQTTSYDFGAPLDEFGLETTKSKHVGRLHRILQEHAGLLLGVDSVPALQSLGEKQGIHTYTFNGRTLSFIYNDDQAEVQVQINGSTRRLPGMSVILASDGKELMNTAEVADSDRVDRTMVPAGPVLGSAASWEEPMPADWPAGLVSETVADRPVEQLLLTKDQTDYCWYSTRITIPETGKGTLKLEGAGDFIQVYIDGKRVAQSVLPLMEERGKPRPGAFPQLPGQPEGYGDGFVQSFKLKLGAGERELALFCSALGMIKGDWMIEANMSEERKGLWGNVLWNDRPVGGPWRMQPGLAGERLGLFGDAGVSIKWKPYRSGGRKGKLRWWRIEFDRPEGIAAVEPLALDLAGMGKGLVWLNGLCLGRYWLQPASSWVRPWMEDTVRCLNIGEPTQRYYQVPLGQMGERNVLVLFEELGGDPGAIRLCRRV